MGVCVCEVCGAGLREEGGHRSPPLVAWCVHQLPSSQRA